MIIQWPCHSQAVTAFWNLSHRLQSSINPPCSPVFRSLNHTIFFASLNEAMQLSRKEYISLASSKRNEISLTSGRSRESLMNSSQPSKKRSLSQYLRDLISQMIFVILTAASPGHCFVYLKTNDGPCTRSEATSRNWIYISELQGLVTTVYY